MQSTVRLLSQTPLCTARLAAEGCQSAVGNAERGRASALKLRPHCVAYTAIWHLSAVIASPFTTYALLCENVTSPIKPELHNVLHCRQRRIEPRPCTENFVKFGHVIFDMRADRKKAYRHTDRHTSQPSWRRSNNHSAIWPIPAKSKLASKSTTLTSDNELPRSYKANERWERRQEIQLQHRRSQRSRITPRLIAVWEIVGLNPTAGSCVYYDSHYDSATVLQCTHQLSFPCSVEQ